jgi:predicted type IV restriction endonuclease
LSLEDEVTGDEYMLALKTLTEDAVKDNVDTAVVLNALLTTFADLATLTHQSVERCTYLLLMHLEESRKAYETRRMQ